MFQSSHIRKIDSINYPLLMIREKRIANNDELIIQQPEQQKTTSCEQLVVWKINNSNLRRSLKSSLYLLENWKRLRAPG